MAEFCAKLHLPRREYVLGALIAKVEPRISHAGIGYANIRFSNYPLIANFNQFDASQVNRSFEQRGLYFGEADIMPQVGDLVHLDVRWVLGPHAVPGNRGQRPWYPNVRLDLRAFVDQRVAAMKDKL